jgi:hypothetical protein
MTLRCDCGAALEMPEGFFDGAVVAFFEAHGHFPMRIVFECQCGATHATGCEVIKDAAAARRVDEAWYRRHMWCQIR